jgi:quercetin dioxygenase-like cupin family protein
MKSGQFTFVTLCASLLSGSFAAMGSAAAAEANGAVQPPPAWGVRNPLTPENNFENDYVILNEAHPNVDVPGYTHKAHIHHFNRVMVYMHDGGEYLHYLDDGRTEDHQWKAGDVVWSPSNGWHYSSPRPDVPPYDQTIPMIVDIGIKQAGDPSKVVITALDPLKVDPKHYKVELDNSQVRVLRVKLGPKESTTLHEIPVNHLVVYMTQTDARATFADGKTEAIKYRPGETHWAAPAKLKVQNLSDKPFEAVIVEIKE